MMQKGDKRVIRGWVMYDWANSVYNLVISSAIFPIFYDVVTSNYYKENTLHIAKDAELPVGTNVTVDFFGWEVSNSALMSFILSASFLVVSFLSPFLSGIADYLGNKKRFLQFFCYLGALSCMTLFFFGDLLEKGLIELGFVSVFFASIGFWNSLVFYNAYLPEIAEPKDHDSISARGFSMGYIGSMLLLVICLVLMKVPAIGMPAKYSFLLVGIWWIFFAQFTYRVLPDNTRVVEKTKGYIWSGFTELKGVFAEFRQLVQLKRYLLAFFFFNTGVQTVMLMAVIFAKKVIFPNDNGPGLIIAILLIQILGAVGAFLMSKVSKRIGNVKTLIIGVSVWILVCIGAYLITTPVEFYVLASFVGLVMGGIQAIARSTYSKFLPETEDHASFFSFYDATEKIGIVCGTLFFGLMEILTGDIRYSVLAVAFFFVVGILLLLRVPSDKAKEA